MIHLIVLYNHTKNEIKPFEEVLEKGPMNFLTLIPNFLKIKNNCKNLALDIFLHLWYFTFMQNFRKILRAVFEENYNGRTDKTRRLTWAIC